MLSFMIICLIFAAVICTSVSFTLQPIYSNSKSWFCNTLSMSSSINGDSLLKQSSTIAVILLAGGQGKRMKSAIPKHFLPLRGKPVFLHSLDLFQKLESVKSIVIVLDESYRPEYNDIVRNDPRIIWADPGK